ncbi:HsdM family class I SAM-dependent methyltransferase [Nonomuraea turcica]|uniref:HsdM family class I SAM-dependent methyltransferase n=1 Tax=Nonomuraea sp. G32 TaxID=3067274 RepID=UPI00273BAFBC|nr:N-6 DNA methylase [Nonomuraea sp. G32]MDP4510671.1 N-6 DNA methylase [Nonomuraea sp. G32]
MPSRVITRSRSQWLQRRPRLYRGAVRAGDAVREDAFGSLQADAVTCVPPFGERNWGYEDLASDIRWLYGLPSRGEPELPWVQHGLYHLKPGRHMAVVMPPAAADRRSGRRIRAQLLRTGTLRAVVSLPAGIAPGALASPHLWVLRRPSPGDPIPRHVLMLDLSDMPEVQLRDAVLERWRTFTASSDMELEGAVPVNRPLGRRGRSDARPPNWCSSIQRGRELLDPPRRSDRFGQ